MNRYTNLQVKN